MNEQWRIVSRDPSYMVSDLGRVKSLPRQVKCRDGYRIVAERIMRPAVGSTGYPQVTLSHRKIVAVHQLVAESFIPNPGRKPQINHINGDRRDARRSNLEWVTASENQQHAYAELGRQSSCKGRFSGQHPTSKGVIARCVKTGAERHFDSAMDAVREGFSSSGISRCARGLISNHGGYVWRFSEPHGDAR